MPLNEGNNEDFVEAPTEPSRSASTIQTNKRKRMEEEEALQLGINPTRIQEKNVSLFRTYRKLNVKLVRCEQHKAYLTRCETRDMVPKTLKSNIQPQVPDTTPEFLFEWEDAQLEFGRTLVKLLIKYWNNRCQIISSQIETMEIRLRDKTTDAEMEHITSLIQKTKLSVEDEISKRPANPPKQQ